MVTAVDSLVPQTENQLLLPPKPAGASADWKQAIAGFGCLTIIIIVIVAVIGSFFSSEQNPESVLPSPPEIKDMNAVGDGLFDWRPYQLDFLWSAVPEKSYGRGEFRDPAVYARALWCQAASDLSLSRYYPDENVRKLRADPKLEALTAEIAMMGALGKNSVETIQIFRDQVENFQNNTFTEKQCPQLEATEKPEEAMIHSFVNIAAGITKLSGH